MAQKRIPPQIDEAKLMEEMGLHKPPHSIVKKEQVQHEPTIAPVAVTNVAPSTPNAPTTDVTASTIVANEQVQHEPMIAPVAALNVAPSTANVSPTDVATPTIEENKQVLHEPTIAPVATPNVAPVIANAPATNFATPTIAAKQKQRYEEVFLQERRIKIRAALTIDYDTAQKISTICRVVFDDKITISNFADNILCQHIEKYANYFNEIMDAKKIRF